MFSYPRSKYGKCSRVVSKIKNVVNIHFIHTQIIIQEQNLIAKQMLPDLNEMLTGAVKVINFIICNAFNSRLFSILCGEIEFELTYFPC